MKAQILRLQQSQTLQLDALLESTQAGLQGLRTELAGLADTARLASSLSGADPAAPATVTASPEQLAREEQARKERLFACLQELIAGNAPNCVEEAFNSLTMMFGNIVKAPTAARYRRLVPSNPVFAKSISPLVGHEKLLSLVGFEFANKAWELKMGSKDEARPLAQAFL